MKCVSEIRQKQQTIGLTWFCEVLKLVDPLSADVELQQARVRLRLLEQPVDLRPGVDSMNQLWS
jgi:hypothetical protein